MVAVALGVVGINGRNNAGKALLELVEFHIIEPERIASLKP
jgi:hypothetical protein